MKHRQKLKKLASAQIKSEISWVILPLRLRTKVRAKVNFPKIISYKGTEVGEKLANGGELNFRVRTADLIFGKCPWINEIFQGILLEFFVLSMKTRIRIE